MMRVVAVIIVSVILLLLLWWGAHERDAPDLTILEVEGAAGLVPEVLGRGCPVVVMAADGVRDAVERHVFFCAASEEGERGDGRDAVVAADFAVLHSVDSVRVVHPVHRPDLVASDRGLVQGRCWRDEGWRYVDVRLPPGGCLILPRRWGVVGWEGEAFHVTSQLKRGVRMLLGR